MCSTASHLYIYIFIYSRRDDFCFRRALPGVSLSLSLSLSLSTRARTKATTTTLLSRWCWCWCCFEREKSQSAARPFSYSQLWTHNSQKIHRPSRVCLSCLSVCLVCLFIHKKCLVSISILLYHTTTSAPKNRRRRRRGGFRVHTHHHHHHHVHAAVPRGKPARAGERRVSAGPFRGVHRDEREVSGVFASASVFLTLVKGSFKRGLFPSLSLSLSHSFFLSLFLSLSHSLSLSFSGLATTTEGKIGLEQV